MASTTPQNQPQKAAPTNFLSRVRDSINRSFNGELNEEDSIQGAEITPLEAFKAQAAPENSPNTDAQVFNKQKYPTASKPQTPIEEPITLKVEEEEVVITSDGPLKENVRRERSVGTWNRIEAPTSRKVAAEAEVAVAVAHYEETPLASSIPVDNAPFEATSKVAPREASPVASLPVDAAPVESAAAEVPRAGAPTEARVVASFPIEQEVYGNEVLNNSPLELFKTSSAAAPNTAVVAPQISTGDSYLDEFLNKLMKTEGAVAVALVDSSSGISMGTAGGGPFDLDVAATGNSEVVKAKLKLMKDLALNDKIEDILITLGEQYHLIYPLKSAPEVFVYLVLNRASANLDMARHKLAASEKDLEI